ncbi:MAG: hypothetical protein Solumvirus1_49 [Solumvirus sp.]|uniref:Uncharacterized protein n=1 Tax=Solumvirus sp. TaxID=2487773 RepID=A0A3G5AHV6_9VIRU|nr:MAG: hypothetical protein Solumvirus1_49 [Solumvirus sp.]
MTELKRDVYNLFNEAKLLPEIPYQDINLISSKDKSGNRLFQGYNYGSQLGTIILSRFIPIKVKTSHFISNVLNGGVFITKNIDVSKYINIPSPISIRSGIAGNYKILGNIPESKRHHLEFGTYINITSGSIVKHGVFYTFYYNSETSNISHYHKVKYDMGIIVLIEVYRMYNVDLYYRLDERMDFDKYGYIKHIESPDFLIDITPEISYSTKIDEDGIVEWFSFYTSDPPERELPYENRPVIEPHHEIDGISYLRWHNGLVYILNQEYLERDDFYNRILDFISLIKNNITNINSIIKDFIYNQDLINIIIDYMATSTNAILKDNLLRTEHVFKLDEATSMMKDDLPMIKKVLDLWPEGW